MARNGHWLAAGCLAALAVLTRNFGVLLLVPMAVYFVERELKPPTLNAGWMSGLLTVSGQPAVFWAFAASVLLPCLALGGFMAFLHERTGDFLAFVTIQRAWGRTADWPFGALLRPVLELWLFPLVLWPSAIAAWVSTGLCIVMFWQRQWAHAAFSFIGLTVLLTAGPLVGISAGSSDCAILHDGRKFDGVLAADWPCATACSRDDRSLSHVGLGIGLAGLLTAPVRRHTLRFEEIQRCCLSLRLRDEPGCLD